MCNNLINYITVFCNCSTIFQCNCFQSIYNQSKLQIILSREIKREGFLFVSLVRGSFVTSALYSFQYSRYPCFRFPALLVGTSSTLVSVFLPCSLRLLFSNLWMASDPTRTASCGLEGTYNCASFFEHRRINTHRSFISIMEIKSLGQLVYSHLNISHTLVL